MTSARPSRTTRGVFSILSRLIPWIFLCSIPVLSVSSCSVAPRGSVADRTQVISVIELSREPVQPEPRDTLRLVSVNLAHGRQVSINQLLVSTQTTCRNLDAVASFLVKVEADVVALQEADSPSLWSGGFHHVDYLAQQSRLPRYAYTEHAQLWIGNYGTAIMSRLPIKSAIGHTFPSTPPTASKGFTLVEVEWPTGHGKSRLVDIVSVHLDFSRKTVRRQQLDELVRILKTRNKPLIIMGDFNSEWLAEQYLVDSFADRSELHVYQSGSEDLDTYKDKRLDWILLTRDLEFDSYRVATEVLSDHRAIVASIRIKPD